MNFQIQARIPPQILKTRKLMRYRLQIDEILCPTFCEVFVVTVKVSPMLACCVLQDKLLTWEHLPPVAVFQSVHKTADLGSFMDTFLVWIELRTSAVLWTDPITADLSSFMDTFRSPPVWWASRTADLSSSMDTFRTQFKNCGPQQFYGHFSDPPE